MKFDKTEYQPLWHLRYMDYLFNFYELKLNNINDLELKKKWWNPKFYLLYMLQMLFEVKN